LVLNESSYWIILLFRLIYITLFSLFMLYKLKFLLAYRELVNLKCLWLRACVVEYRPKWYRYLFCFAVLMGCDCDPLPWGIRAVFSFTCPVFLCRTPRRSFVLGSAAPWQDILWIRDTGDSWFWLVDVSLLLLWQFATCDC